MLTNLATKHFVSRPCQGAGGATCLRGCASLYTFWSAKIIHKAEASTGGLNLASKKRRGAGSVGRGAARQVGVTTSAAA